MNVNISEFIKNNYDIVYKGVGVNSEDFSDVDEFLLADIHNSDGHSETNSLFINTFSNKSDAVLVEAIPSMQKIERDQALQSVWLTSDAPIFGWDSGTLAEIMDCPLLCQMGEIEIKGNILKRQILDPNFSDKIQDLKTELVELCKRAMSMTMEVMSLHAYIFDRIEKTMPVRVKSMKDSLIKAREVSSRTFLIAGEAHLKNEHVNDSPLSLGDFHEFLDSRKVVVLLPKQERVSEMGAKRAVVAAEANMVALFAWIEEKK